jgi:ABC-type Fe3+/spermidine/putrescine transport system ATPase subunit
MRSGRILQLGEPADIYYRPADPFVAGFIGDTNLIPVSVTGRSGAGLTYVSDEIADVSGAVPASMAAADVGQGPALMMVRPELIRRVPEGEAVECEVFTKGGTVQYRARTPKGFDLAVEIQGTSLLPMALGESVRLGWQKKDIWVLKPGEA